MALLTKSIFIFMIGIVCAHRSSLNDVIFSGDYEFIDLSYSFDKNTIYWINSKNFELTNKVGYYGEDSSWYAANEYAAAEHGGTHLDAPYHFHRTGKYVGDITMDRLIASLVIVDISSLVNGNPNFVLYKHHLDYLLNVQRDKPCLIVFKFGWSKFANDKTKYLGQYNNKTLNFPGLSAEIAEWITTSYKNVVGIGVDVASVDPGSSIDFPVHKIFSKAGLYNIENVKLDGPVPEYGCTALAMPMKIALGTGAPLRLVAICLKQTPKKFYKDN